MLTNNHFASEESMYSHQIIKELVVKTLSSIIPTNIYSKHTSNFVNDE